MEDSRTTTTELLEELAELRQRLAEAEAAAATLKATEEAFKQERILLRTLVDNLPDAIYVKDIACCKTLANSADLRNMGKKSEAEVLGKNDFAFFPKEMASAFFADDQLVIQTGQPVMNREEHVFDEEGKKRWLLTSKLPLRDDKGVIIGLIGIGRDMTKRKMAEEALRESKEKFQLIFEHAFDGLSVFEESPIPFESKLVDCNSRYAAMSGRTREELLMIGKTRELTHTLSRGDNKSEGPTDTFQGSFSWIRPDGKENIIEYTAVSIKLQGKTFTIGIDRDVTERKMAEAERERLIKELQSALGDIKTLSGLVPICAHCKNIRDDKGYWTRLEQYIQERTPAHFSHGICPVCVKELYPELQLEQTNPVARIH